MTWFLIFFVGFLIPFIARRFGKFDASDPAKALICLFHKPAFPSNKKNHRYPLWQKKERSLYTAAFLWGIFAMLFYGAILTCFSSLYQPWFLVLGFFLFILSAIDNKWFILPDVLTIPLLLTGLAFNYFTGFIPIESSLFGAFYGYFLPTLCLLLTYRFKKDCFGFGDIKMMIGLGAWLGFEKLTAVVVISCLSFALRSLILKKKENAYGPDLSIATLIVLFSTFFYH